MCCSHPGDIQVAVTAATTTAVRARVSVRVRYAIFLP